MIANFITTDRIDLCQDRKTLIRITYRLGTLFYLTIAHMPGTNDIIKTR